MGRLSRRFREQKRSVFQAFPGPASPPPNVRRRLNFAPFAGNAKPRIILATRPPSSSFPPKLDLRPTFVNWAVDIRVSVANKYALEEPHFRPNFPITPPFLSEAVRRVKGYLRLATRAPPAPKKREIGRRKKTNLGEANKLCAHDASCLRFSRFPRCICSRRAPAS